MLVLVLFMCITAVTLTRFPGFVEHYTHLQGKIVAKMDDLITIPLQPKQEVQYGEHQFYMLPKSPFEKAIGILIVLHPCKRSGLEFFLLPEDRILAKEALQQGRQARASQLAQEPRMPLIRIDKRIRIQA